jgi:hypothetical protein
MRESLPYHTRKHDDRFKKGEIQEPYREGREEREEREEIIFENRTRADTSIAFRGIGGFLKIIAFFASFASFAVKLLLSCVSLYVLVCWR